MSDPRSLLDTAERRHASVCGHCDAGLPMNCTCGDPRRAVGVLSDALRAVLAIHEPTRQTERPSNVCPECYAAAPCDTVQAITTALGGDDDD